MAISSSGSIGFDTLQTEFGGSNPIGISEYYNKDPYKPTPSSGAIDLNSFRGSSSRTCEINSGYTSEPSSLNGYGQANGSYYHALYSGNSGAAFGTITKTTGLVSGRTVCSICAWRDYDSSTGWFSNYYNVALVQRGSGNSGFTTMKARYGSTILTFNRTSASYYSPASGVSPSGSWWRWSSTYGTKEQQLFSRLQAGGKTQFRFD